MPEPFQGRSEVLKCEAHNADCSPCFPHAVTIPFSFSDLRSEIEFSFGIFISASAKFQVFHSLVNTYHVYSHTR